MEQTKKVVVDSEVARLEYDSLNAIHRLVFNNFQYVSDFDNYGMLERWINPDPNYNGTQLIKGDCEDFALHVRKLLLDRTIPSRIVVCQTERGELHCVISVNLTSGNYIFDNRFPEVKTRTELDTLGYRWIKASDFKRTDCTWFSIASIDTHRLKTSKL